MAYWEIVFFDCDYGLRNFTIQVDCISLSADFIENEACRDKVVLDDMAGIRFENFRRKYGYKSEIAIWRYTESLGGLESL